MKQKSTGSESESFDASIDAVRFLAFFLVFIAHISDTILQRTIAGPSSIWSSLVQTASAFGRQGVTIFFTLTGFLLARVLIREARKQGEISIKNFYIRRILRIWPLYFLFILACLSLSLFSQNPTIHLIEIPFLLTFTYNLGQIYYLLPHSFATITWSLSVEEQIYLFFPWAMKKIGSKYFHYWLYSIAVIGLFARVLEQVLQYHRIPNTLGYLDVIIIGTFFALYEERIQSWFSYRSTAKLVASVAFIVLYICYYRSIDTASFGKVIAPDITALVAILLILIFRQIKKIDSIRAVKTLGYLGRRSYGMYLFHWVIINVMFGRNILYSDATGFSLMGSLSALTATILLSLFSYKYFEQPFLTFRRRFQANK